MKIVSICAAKGGCTKSSVTASLAVRASGESRRIALFDLNGDQGDLTQWWILRGHPANPRIIEVEKISQDIEVLRAEKFDWLFIDTPPVDLDIIENAVLKSDCVIIPVRPSMFDINGVTPVVEMCRERRKPYSFLLSAVDAKMPKLTESAMSALVNDGQIFASRISYRQSYITAISRGKTGAEIDQSLQTEIDNLWVEVKRLASTPISISALRGRIAS
jgi:chromosome partitioning protein